MAAEINEQLLEARLFSFFREWTWSERERDTSSWMWNSGYDIQKDGHRRWVCKACIRLNRPVISSFIATGLQNARSHLWRDHNIGAPEGEKKCEAQLQKEGIANQRSITSTFKLDLRQSEQQKLANTLIQSFDRHHLQQLLVDFIVSSNLPFSLVDNPRFRNILEYLNLLVAIQKAIPTSSSIRRIIFQEYKIHRHTVIEALRKSIGKIHVSFDGWTSPNQLALYGIACFYRNEAGRPSKILLGVPEACRNFGATIAGEVLEVLFAFGIGREKIGYFTLDNAENNSTAMEVIGAELGFEGRLRRGRCIGHTINLAAKALLFGHHPDAFEQQLTGALPLTDYEYQRWRLTGPVGKLHNLVIDIRNIHWLSFRFRRIQQDEIDRAPFHTNQTKKPLRLVSDNATRWLSQLYMIRRALQLKVSIKMLLVVAKENWEAENRSKRSGKVSAAKLAKLPRYLRDENQLTDNDWEVLRYLEQILTVFETVVKTLEGDGQIRKRCNGWLGSYGNIWDAILGFELLLSKLEEFKLLAEGFPDSEHFRIGINLAWEKLDTYYQRLDETPIYYAAMALHPAYRWDWFEEMWQAKPEWIEKAKSLVHDAWLADYAYLDVRTTSRGSNRSDDEPAAKRPRFFNPFEATSRLTQPTYTVAVQGDEYRTWQRDREVSDSEVRDPLLYWLERKERYPRLSQMAMDFLTIQPMSAECERAFSAAGKMVIPLRASLDAQTIGICQVLRSWYRAGILQGDNDDILPTIMPESIDSNNQAIRESWLEGTSEVDLEGLTEAEDDIITFDSDSD